MDVKARMEKITGDAALMATVEEASREAGVPPWLALGLAHVESGGDPHMARIYPVWLNTVMRSERPVGCAMDTERMFQKTAWGLTQVMGSAAREAGFTGWLTALVEPELNLRVGIAALGRTFAQHADRHGIEGALAAWKMGSPRRLPDGTFSGKAWAASVLKAAEGYRALFAKGAEEAPEAPSEKADPRKKKSEVPERQDSADEG